MIHRHLRSRRRRNRINEIERAVCTVAICDIADVVGDTYNRPAESGSGDGRTRTEEIKSEEEDRGGRGRRQPKKEEECVVLSKRYTREQIRLAMTTYKFRHHIDNLKSSADYAKLSTNC